MSAPPPDAAARYLDVVVRLLPSARSQWGEAMRAELGTITSPAERRRFALGCTRVALSPTPGTRAIAHHLAALGAAALVLAAALALTRAIGPTVPVLVLLAVLAWLGRRPGPFGPVAPGRAARAVRIGGLALVGSFLLVMAVERGTAGLLQPDHDGTVVTLLLTFLAAALLAVTARASRLADAALGFGSAAGLASGVAAFAVLPFAHHAEPLAARLPGRGTWLALVVFGAPALAALLTHRRTRCGDQAVAAALCAGMFAALVAALAGLGTVALLPGQIPHLPGEMMLPGTSASARAAEDAIAASDDYAGLLLFGTLLTASLWAMARPPSRAWMTVGLLAVLGLPPIALAASAQDFPGITAITTATVLVVVAAVATTRAGTARSS